MQNVIVTGGSRGLGLAMCGALAAAGYRVIALARKGTDGLAAAGRAAADMGRLLHAFFAGAFFARRAGTK